MSPEKLRILVFGAHPDDADIDFGGCALKYTALGHTVTFVSCTNGDTGHHEIGGIELARRRFREAQASARIAGLDAYEVLDIHSGELEPTVANRKQIIRMMREFKPDLILTHRPYDYHPDHRATSQLVLDASYIVTVPNMQALTEHLSRPLRIFYLYDKFQRPCPFRADIAVRIDEVIEKKLDMAHCHSSQMYEWLPFNQGKLERVPGEEKDRRSWLAGERLPQFAEVADSCREKLVELYGPARGRAVRYAEAFEACEYGAGFKAEELRRLFPFFD